jgi:hypothetical protein
MLRILAATILLGLATGASAQQAAPEPGLEFVYRARVALGAATDVGDTARGHRRIIPIVGGTFEGPDIRGEVMPMGWDWQLDRADGCTDVEADYFIRTDDGVMINVINKGTICRTGADGAPPPPVRTSPVFEVPRGRYEWLGQGGFIGTLGLDPEAREPTVVITIYRAT